MQKYILASLVYPCIRVCALRFVARHGTTIDFGPEGVCGDPVFAPPFTSARVQSRFEFVELGSDMFSNCQGDIPAFNCNYRLVPARTTHYIMCTSIYVWYVEVPGSPVPYVRIYECVRTLCDVRMAYTGFCCCTKFAFIWTMALMIFCTNLLYTLYTQIYMPVFISH